jgi:predicted dehydrogenase
MHHEWTLAALRAGKHVLCEKPLASSVAEAEEMFDVAQQTGRVLVEAFMYRSHPQTLAVIDAVRQGAIGELKQIRTNFCFRTTNVENNIRFNRDLDGGALMDVGCYCVNAARLLAGEPVTVTGAHVTGGDGIDVAFVGTLQFDDEVLAHFDAGFVFSERHDLEIVGEQASLFVTDPWHCRRPGIELRRGQSAELIEIPAVDSYRLEAENLSAAIRGWGSPLLGRADAAGQARTIEALYAAAGSGRSVELASD